MDQEQYTKAAAAFRAISDYRDCSEAAKKCDEMEALRKRRLAEEHGDSFAIRNGNRLLIIRRRFEEYILSRLTGGEGGNRI